MQLVRLLPMVPPPSSGGLAPPPPACGSHVPGRSVAALSICLTANSSTATTTTAITMITIVDMARGYPSAVGRKPDLVGSVVAHGGAVLQVKPDWFTGPSSNPLVTGLHRLGISVQGSQTLAVRGRKSGEMRTNPVNPFELDGKTYLLAPRGNTQWVRNMRAAGEGELRSGRKVRHFHADRGPGLREAPADAALHGQVVLGGEGLPRHRRGCVRRGDRADHAGPPGLRAHASTTDLRRR